jgi:hypothetical protein
MMLQFGGCSIGGITRWASIGFARELGAIPATVVYDAYIAPLVAGIIPDGGGDGTTE